MELLFRSLPKGEMERDPTQRDQFDNEDVELVDAIVRESIQNSLDAKAQGSHEPVRVDFKLLDLEGERLAAAHGYLRTTELNNHLQLCGLPPVETDGSMKVLVIEDFGTSGLTGRWDDWDEEPFCDFWRRMGRSHKAGKALGRWGLGKLVFSSASQARVFLGLTLTNKDSKRLLMGQAVLKHHDLPDGRRLDSHGFYAVDGPDGIQLPVVDQLLISAFATTFGLERADDAGLSIVVPWARGNLSSARIIQGVLRNYFFPILFGKLEVSVGETRITAESYGRLASEIDPEHFGDGHLAAFILAMKESRGAGVAGQLTLPLNWAKGRIEDALGTNLEWLRSDLNEGRVVEVRAPMTLKLKDGTERPTFIDVFLQRAPADHPALFVRRAIVLNAEQRYFRGRKIFAALIADDDAASEFLGDAENPAHTGWSASAEKVVTKWRASRDRLMEVRQLLQRLHNALVSAVETFDRDALRDVFSIHSPDGSSRPSGKGDKADPPQIPRIEARPKAFRVTELPDGFGIRSGSVSEGDRPLSIRICVAYDVLRGNPFKKHDPADFDFTDGKLLIEAMGATVSAISPSVLQVDATSAGFAVNVRGFDRNRDLIVNPENLS